MDIVSETDCKDVSSLWFKIRGEALQNAFRLVTFP
jgi:hypothetical protein